jgi:hypothetical protein
MRALPSSSPFMHSTHSPRTAPLRHHKKLSRALEELGTYIDNNAGAIVNYGERRRCGERISTGFVESTINQLVAKRFMKKQQMRWTPRGAHLLLQVRVHVLNDELGAGFSAMASQIRQWPEGTTRGLAPQEMDALSSRRCYSPTSCRTSTCSAGAWRPAAYVIGAITLDPSSLSPSGWEPRANSACSGSLWHYELQCRSPNSLAQVRRAASFPHDSS